MIFKNIDEQRTADADHVAWSVKELMLYYGIIGLSVFIGWLLVH